VRTEFKLGCRWSALGSALDEYEGASGGERRATAVRRNQTIPAGASFYHCKHWPNLLKRHH